MLTSKSKSDGIHWKGCKVRWCIFLPDHARNTRASPLSFNDNCTGFLCMHYTTQGTYTVQLHISSEMMKQMWLNVLLIKFTSVMTISIYMYQQSLALAYAGADANFCVMQSTHIDTHCKTYYHICVMCAQPLSPGFGLTTSQNRAWKCTGIVNLVLQKTKGYLFKGINMIKV